MERVAKVAVDAPLAERACPPMAPPMRPSAAGGPRFPNIKIASIENGCEWLPRFLYKMDKMRGMARLGWWPMGQLKERPSSIFKRHCFVVASPEDDIHKVAAEMGGDIDCLLMGSDYPHAEGVPQPRDFADEACAGLTAEQTYKIMYANGRRFLPRGENGLAVSSS